MSAKDREPERESEWQMQAARAPAPKRMPQQGDLIADKYRIEQLIGQGGMGAVFRATHTVMDSPVAVKWLMPDMQDHEGARERFVREARAAARIRHPNVVQVFDVGEQDGGLYIVMEYLDGEPFSSVLERGSMPIPDALRLLVQGMWGVAAAHAKGIVHRDIKPENLFVIDDPTGASGRNTKILDFGISKLKDDDHRNTGLTRTGVTMGTPHYMSFEQFNGARDVDTRTDVYAFGVMLYRALTGKLPFNGSTIGAIAVAVATETPPTPKSLRPDLPQALSDLVTKAIARDREDRHETVGALLDEVITLTTAEGYLGQMTQPSTIPPSLTPCNTSKLPAVSQKQAALAPTQAEPVAVSVIRSADWADRRGSRINRLGGQRSWWAAGLLVLTGLAIGLALMLADQESVVANQETPNTDTIADTKTGDDESPGPFKSHVDGLDKTGQDEGAETIGKDALPSGEVSPSSEFLRGKDSITGERVESEKKAEADARAKARRIKARKARIAREQETKANAQKAADRAASLKKVTPTASPPVATPKLKIDHRSGSVPPSI